MAYTTYENVANPHVTIHKDGCSFIKMHGGEHKYGQGQYRYHDTFDAASNYSITTHLPMKNCHFCKPK